MCIKMNLDTDITTFTKINTKWTIDINVKCKIINLLEDNSGENLDDLGYGNDFLDTNGMTHERRNWKAGLH